MYLQRSTIKALFGITLFFFTVQQNLKAQNLNAGNVATALHQILEQKPDQQYFHILISLKSQVDLSRWQQGELRSSISRDQQVASLINALQTNAAATQPRLVDWMQAATGVKKNSVKTYWIANIIELQASASFVAELSNHPEVDWIEPFPEMSIEKYPSAPASPLLSPGGVEPGLNAINARALWRLGYTGYGRKVLIVDSGQEYEHPALRTQFAYNYGSQSATYRSSILGDLCGDHGTAVAAVAVGLDRLTRDTVGAAFNALWMGGPAAFRNPGTSEICPLEGISTSTIEVLQWALNPDGNTLTSSDIPDVINNSWGNSNSAEECRNSFRSVVQALDAAGIAVVFAAGNRGPDPSTVNLPGGLNLDLVVPMSIGSINGNTSNYPISDFSSRGPTVCGRDGSFLIKPEVVAPGERVRTATLQGGYSTVDGTSFSAPYVSGAILLLKEAFPTLSGKQLGLALYNSARDLGPTGEDNDYGRGLIDVGAAYNWLISQGFKPSPPIRATNDVIHVQAKPRIFGCDRQAYLEVSFENSGSDTLRSMDIVIRRDGQGNPLSQHRWTGKLAPGKLTNYVIPPFDAPLGRYVVEVELRNPNGFADARALNNQIKTFINVAALPQLPKTEASATNICANNEVTLSSNHTGEGTVRWFNQNSGGTVLGTGNSFKTGALTKDTVLFAELTFNRSTGRLDQSGGEVVYNDSVGGLVFDAYYDFILKSVTIYPNRTGLRFFTLRNATGGVQTISYRVSRVGEQKVPLNFKVTPGANQVLELTRGAELSILKTNSSYPIAVADVLAIKYANNVEGTDDYPYFFNWEIEHGYPCGRTLVFIDVTEKPRAQFALPNSPPKPNTSLSFQDLSTGASAYLWNFGDGQSSTERNPSIVYAAAGSYQVSLSVTNSLGCSDTKVQTIQVSPSTSTTEQDALAYQFNVFPNPAQSEAYVTFNFDRSRSVRISLINSLGQVLRFQNLGERQTGQERILLNQLPSGNYWLMFDVDGTRVAKPLLKR